MHSFASLFKFQLSHVTARFILSLLALSPLVPVAAADSPNPTDCKL